MKEQKKRRQGHKGSGWKLFDAVNYRFFGAGIVVLIAGYLAMMQGPHDSFLSLHLAPVLLVIGYCVLIPLAILKRSKGTQGD
ncbi:hypothetical protein CEE37_10145 [candidate division LCP-89 bacterium B3_LCP]|uniref:DUF3098 domain-containing protein n=1 Tax=candidate division LCP-89 bacterium B3_LCP TaxID=2012998 RepID=A0A532UZC6_UNCL8|nr:MAG: hypothetical protein CEE37_10145 [candidate division LCP-89 bacterium B3_LCP]